VSELFDFDLDIDPESPAAPQVQDAGKSDRLETLDEWAEEQLSQPFGPLFFDIETGPRPEEELRQLYHEKTLEEFSDTCDKRWKPETVAAKFKEYQATAWQEFVSRAALSPTTGRVLLIGALNNGNFRGFGKDDEAANIIAFWDVVAEAMSRKVRIIGHNSNSFDLPFLVRRSWLLGVPVPRETRQGRYWNPLFVDTMEVWGCGSRDFTSLNALGAAFGVGQKTEGVNGGDFAKLWFGSADDRRLAIDYNEQDLRLTAAIAAKMGLM
jgi:DNA polymerase elongation subunit (family B)